MSNTTQPTLPRPGSIGQDVETPSPSTRRRGNTFALLLGGLILVAYFSQAIRSTTGFLTTPVAATTSGAYVRKESAQKEPTSHGREEESKLLPGPMDLLKRGIPLSDLYGGSFSSSYHADSRDSVLCSCLSPDSKSNCCLRRIERFHKMGWALIKELFDRKKMKKKGFGGGENIEILRAGRTVAIT